MKTMKAQLVRQASVLLLVSAFICGATLCARGAAAPASPAAASGPISFTLTNLTAPVYDLTGGYRLDQSAQGASGSAVNLTLRFAMQQDASGRLRGSGLTNIQVAGVTVPAQYTVNGKVGGGGVRGTRAAFSVRWVSQDTTGTNGPFTITVQYTFTASPLLLQGMGRGRAKFANLGSSNIRPAATSLLLPSGTDGSWTLQLNQQSVPGSGAIVFPNRRTVQTSLASNAAAPAGVEHVKLAGLGGDRATALNVFLASATSTLQSLSGKVLGQTVIFKGTALGTPGTGSPPVTASATIAGSQACQECHSPTQQTLNETRHAQVGVQCESCHGGAASHAANPGDPASVPNLTPLLTATTCGSCHPHTNIFAQWQTSGHAIVVEDLNPASTISSCGRCHSGTVHEAMLDGRTLPVGNANVPLGCPTCHEPHELTGHPAQVRNPEFSTNDYFLATSDVFTNKYDPNINLCAQCHNHRGANYTDSSRPPHESPQYNMLLGTVGELDPAEPRFQPSPHALLITNQCVGCHMQGAAFGSTTNSTATNHTFAVTRFDFCATCHGSAAHGSNLMVFVSAAVTGQIQAVQASLNQWAMSNAPAALFAKYGTRAWEYTNPGQLSPGGPGPNATEQTLIPDTIKKARFNLYLALHDGSFGVHNSDYSVLLLVTAQNQVNAALGP